MDWSVDSVNLCLELLPLILFLFLRSTIDGSNQSCDSVMYPKGCHHSRVIYLSIYLFIYLFLQKTEAFIQKWFITRSFSTQSYLVSSGSQKYAEPL